ncbi:MAG: hypothetical protein OEL79_08805 [Chromatiales bacterium]|nr:hypothetical protein [Chromatiales bacterium]
MGIYEVDTLIEQTRHLAAEYRRATGKPLPVTTEIANHDAARLLELEIINPPPGGYDAVGKTGEREGLRYQIKGRAIFDEKKGGQRLGQLKIDKEWDAVLLVLLDDNYQPISIYEASRDELEGALDESLKSNRSNRGAMSIARFKNISRLVWSDAEGLIEEELWENSAN